MNGDVGDLGLADLALVVLEAGVKFPVVAQKFRKRRDLQLAVGALVDQPVLLRPGANVIKLFPSVIYEFL